MRMNRFFLAGLLCALLVAALPLAAQEAYRRAPKAVQEVLDAHAPPVVSVSPSRDRALIAEPLRYPRIAELAEPMLRLAGLRIQPSNNAPHTAQRYANLRIKSLSGGAETPITAPANARISLPVWSPDGKQFSFTATTATSVYLWVGNAATAATRQLPGIKLNTIVGPGCSWMPDAKHLLCWTVPAVRGKAPDRNPVPVGPNVQESYGRAADLRTFQDLLQNPHDEAVFDYHLATQLALVDAATGKMTPIGKPDLIVTADPAPDGKHLLVRRTHRPYSYILTIFAFPEETEVWDTAGKMVFRLASIPLQDNLPNGGVPTGPRAAHWRPTDPATLVWVEALDAGDPKNRVPHRDKVMWLKAPFKDAPAELAKTQHRYAGVQWGQAGNLAILREFDREKNWTRTWFLNPHHPDMAPRLVWDMSISERYKNPGTPSSKRLATGHLALRQHGAHIFLTGAGASPEGDRPFLDRFNTTTLNADRLFRSGEKSYETVSTLLADDGSEFITRYESPAEPPNFFIRTASSDARQVFTSYADPHPQLQQIKKQLVKYKRVDGQDLSFTMYLPPDYKEGERRPAVVWAYPQEFTDPAVAGQVSASPYRFNTFAGISHLFYTLAGYVVLDDATMPVVGNPETVNNTYVEQIVSSAKAAIDKAAEMGVIDPNRVGVGGHSYGAFMTANLLAHSDLFRAGVARSGAYNRTLTPFGFQSERRTLWQATEMYMKVSPFLHAHKIKEPILLIHGEADNNSGTFPIQSERMYQAIRGNGGNVRYVTLPHESHGYSARESVEHTLWEMLHWFDKHVKNAEPAQQRAASQP